MNSARSWLICAGFVLVLGAGWLAERSVLAQVGSSEAASPGEGNDSGPAAPVKTPDDARERTATRRPAWVEAKPERIGGEYRIPVRVGPYASPLECEARLPETVALAIDDYIELVLGPEARGKVKLPWSYVEEKLIRERFDETRLFQLTSTQQSEMHTLHVLLAFDQSANQYLRQLWRTAQGMTRLVRLGILFAVLVWSLAVIWSYLRLDLATAGRYRWPLRGLATGLLALPWLVLGFFVFR